MRRISTSIVIALSTLLLVSMSSAQQKSQPQTSNPAGQKPPISRSGLDVNNLLTHHI